MTLLGVFLIAAALVFARFRMKGEPVADCAHKAAVGGIMATLIALAVTTAFSYV